MVVRWIATQVIIHRSCVRVTLGTLSFALGFCSGWERSPGAMLSAVLSTVSSFVRFLLSFFVCHWTRYADYPRG